jgi:hypothetical protein
VVAIVSGITTFSVKARSPNLASVSVARVLAAGDEGEREAVGHGSLVGRHRVIVAPVLAAGFLLPLDGYRAAGRGRSWAGCCAYPRLGSVAFGDRREVER